MAEAESASPRIAVVVKTWPKLSETFILEEVLGLERRGLQLHIFSLQGPTDERTHPEVAKVAASSTVLDEGLTLAGRARLLRRPIRLLRAVHRARRRGDDPSTVRAGLRLAGHAARFGADRVHVHFISQPATVARIAAEALGVPFSISAHAKDIYLTPPDEVSSKLADSSFTTTCTGHNADELRRLRADADVRCIHHGVDVTRFAPQPDREPTDVPVVLAVGRLREKKGFDTLLQASAELVRSGVPHRVRIVGYGPQEKALRDMVRDLGLGEVVSLVGTVTRDEVVAEYRNATVVAQPCRVLDDGDRDGIPNVLLEAMASAVPVVTTAVSGIPELVSSEHTGLLVPPHDPRALARALERVITDPRLAHRLGSAGRAEVERSWTAERSAARVHEALAEQRVAYVVKGYPRQSEIFIASELHRLEQAGRRPRLFVIKHGDEALRPQVADRIHAVPEYLPPCASISGMPAWRWAAGHLRGFGPALSATATRHPIRFVRVGGLAVAQSIRARRGWRPRKVYLKEFFQAAEIAHRVAGDRSVLHLHAHFAHGCTTVAWWAAELSGRSFSFTGHAKDIYLPSLNPTGLLARKMRAAAFVVTCTEANRGHLHSLAPATDVHRIYHGLNVDFTALLASTPAPPAAARARERFEILSVGRLVEKKGFDTLFDATAALIEAGLDVTLRVVGDAGDAAGSLWRQVEELGLDGAVTFVPSMSQADLLEEYLAADVFCLPCRIVDNGDRDGIPNVVMEAMSVGLPVVTTGISGIPEMVENRHNGMLVPPEDPVELAKVLEELATDRDLRQTLAVAARHTVAERFDAVAEAERLVALFDEQLRVRS